MKQIRHASPLLFLLACSFAFAQQETIWTTDLETVSHEDHAGYGHGYVHADHPSDARGLAESVSVEVRSDSPPPLTAEFLNLPPSHDGEAFSFELAFSDSPSDGFEVLGGEDGQSSVIEVSGGEVTGANLERERRLRDHGHHGDGGRGSLRSRGGRVWPWAALRAWPWAATKVWPRASEACCGT